MKKKILFLCTGNSCRSQMAEGLFRSFWGTTYDVYSAGTQPSFVHPLAVEVMNEIKIDISQQTSNSLQEYDDIAFDILVTVCDQAKEHCPIFPRQTKVLHWSFSDPAKAIGSQDEILCTFRVVRDQIQKALVQEFQ